MKTCLPQTLIASLMLMLPVSLTAQQSPAARNTSSAAAPNSDSSVSEEVTVLPEFSVTATKTNEYVAAESTTGTRVATKLLDLPFTVNVITAEFLDDFAAFEFREQTAYTSNVVGYETISTGYSVRGIDANVQLRNGFRRIGLIDKVSVERVEVIKGAAASIYGTVMPGGTVNIITRKPKNKREQRVSFTVGSNSLYRGQASATGPLGTSNKLFYRVDLASDTTEYDIEYKKKKQTTLLGSLLWKMAPTTSLLFEYEYLKRNEYGMAGVLNRRRTIADPYFVNSTRTFNSYAGLALEVFDYNFQGPGTYGNRDIHTLTATFEHRFNHIFSMRSSVNWFTRTLERNEYAGRDYEPITQSVSMANTRMRPYDEGGAAWQTDFLASWRTGPVSHKTLLTFDYQRQIDKPSAYESGGSTSDAKSTPISVNGTTRYIPHSYPGAVDLPSGTAFNGAAGTHVQIGGNTYVIRPDNTLAMPVDAPRHKFFSYHDNPAYYRLSENEDNSLDLFGIFLSERATFWNDRATFLAGIRYDWQRNNSRNLLTSDFSKRNTSEPSYQLGLNFRLMPSITTYANISRSFVPRFGTGFDEDGNRFDLPNEFGKCWELGFKASALDGRLTFTLAHFDLSRNNVTRDASRDDGFAYQIVTGREISKGYEFDFNWAIVRSLQVFGGCGYTDSQVMDSTNAPNFEGMPTRRTPRRSLGVGAKYAVPSGPLKGLYATIGYKYADRSLTPGPGRRTINSSQGDIRNIRMPNGKLILPPEVVPEGAILPRNSTIPGTTSYYIIQVDDGRENLWNKPYSIWETSIGYRFKTARRYSHKLQFNMTNIFDYRYTYGSGGHGAGRAWMLTYDLSF